MQIDLVSRRNDAIAQLVMKMRTIVVFVFRPLQVLGKLRGFLFKIEPAVGAVEEIDDIATLYEF